jgi:ArsR family transcriptional regulator
MVHLEWCAEILLAMVGSSPLDFRILIMSKKSSRAAMSEAALEMIAARFRALGEASRLKLIIALESGEQNVSSLAAVTAQKQANVSRHLQALTEAGLLGRRKEGAHVYYFIADDSIFEMCDHVCGSLQRRINAQAGAFHPVRPERKPGSPSGKTITKQ